LTVSRSRRGLSFGMMGASAVLVSAMALLVRATAGLGAVNAYQTTFYRFAIGAAVVGSFLVARGAMPRARNWRWLLVRGGCGAGAMLIYFHSITSLGVAKATILLYTNVVWAALLAPVLLRDRVGARLWVAVGVSFAGVCLVLAPAGGLATVSRDDALALAAGLMGGVAVVAVKKVRDTDDTSTVFLALAGCGVALTAGPAIRAGLPTGGDIWALLVGIGVTGTLAKLLSDSAYRYVRGIEGAILSMLTPVVNVVAGPMIFGEQVSARGALGSCLVVAACVWVMLPSRAVVGSV
jgi:drug/metabolite transporter (DMT)-like permease